MRRSSGYGIVAVPLISNQMTWVRIPLSALILVWLDRLRQRSYIPSHVGSNPTTNTMVS